MWVARISHNCGNFFDYELSPYFDNPVDCLKYIEQNLAVIEFLLSECFYRINTHYFENGKSVHHITLSLGTFVRPYNINQKRFADSFDF